MTLIPIFLAFQGPAGDTKHVQLPRSEPCATTFLPNSCDHGIDLFHRSNGTHSSIRIQIYPSFLLLSVWDDQYGQVSILTSSGDTVELPLSTTAETKSCILLDGSQFVSPSGRWTVEFDLDYSISNSMNPPQLPSTSPVKQDSHGTNSYSEGVEHAVHPMDRTCDDDSGFFENILQQQDTTASTLKPSVATGNTIFGNGDDAGKNLRKKIDEAFERHQFVLADDNEKNASGVEASEIGHQNHTRQVLALPSEHEQEPEDPETEPPSSAHGEAEHEYASGNDGTAASHSMDSEATSDEDVGTSSDHEEPSPPGSFTSLKRQSGIESQLVLQKSAASSLYRASGQESQEIPEYEVGEVYGYDMSEELQPIDSNIDNSLYWRTAGQESQEIPKESLTEQHGKQDDFPDSSTAAPAIHGLDQDHLLGSLTEPQGPLTRAAAEESQVLPLQPPQRHSQCASPVPQQAPVSLTPIRAQTSTTSVYATTKAPRSSLSPQAREPPIQRKRKFSEPAHTERSALEKGPLRAPLQIMLEDDDNTASEVSSVAGRAPILSTPMATANDNDGVEGDTIVVNMSQSTRSSKRRRVLADATSTLPVNPKVVFSLCTIHKKTNTMESFYALGGQVVDNVAEADILCVPNISANTELKKTPKLLLAVVLGKAIVTEKWIVDCHRAGQHTRKFPDPASYIPLDTKRERSWRFNLKAAIKRGRSSTGKLRKLLEDWKVYVTTQLRKKIDSNWDSFKDVVLNMGAKNIYVRLPSDIGMNHAIVLGDEDDFDAVNVGKLGYPLYSKDLLTMAVLRGKLELDTAEFELEIRVKEESDSPS